MTPDSDDGAQDAATTVSVPITAPADPFETPEYLDVDPAVADQWDRRRWRPLA